MKVVQKRKGAEAIKEAKKGKVYRRKNKNKLNKLAKQRYKTMTPAEKLKFHARQVFTKAMRHGATEAEAKKVVAAWKKRRKHRAAGSHAAGQKREVTAAQRQIREQIRKKSLGLQSAHQKALSKIRSAKVAPAKRAAMRQAEKSRYANERKNLAAERTKAAASHRQAMAKIKPKGKFSLKSLISNFKAKPISSAGKRLVDIGAKAAKDGVARIAAKHFGTKKPAAKKAAGGVTKKAPKAAAKPAASNAPAPAAAAPAKKRGRPAGSKNKAKEAAAPAPAAKAVEKKKPRVSRKAPTATHPAAADVKLKKDGTPAKKRGRKPNAEKAAAAPAAKPAAKAPTKKAAAKKPAAKAPAAEAPVAKKRGRPAGSKNKAKETEAKAPVKAAGKKSTDVASKHAKKQAAKAPAKAAKAPAKAAKAPTKAAAAKKPAAKAPSAKAAPAKAAAGKKSGGAVPKARFA
jgi:hypothetical protein